MHESQNNNNTKKEAYVNANRSSIFFTTMSFSDNSPLERGTVECKTTENKTFPRNSELLVVQWWSGLCSFANQSR